MKPMRMVARTCFFVLFLFSGLFPLTLLAQEATVTEIIEQEGFQPVTLAIPHPYLMVPEEDVRQWGRLLRDTLIHDLTFSQLFHVLPEAIYDELPPYMGESMDLMPWRANQVQFLVLLKVGRAGDNVVVECRLWDVAADEMRIGRRYVWSPKLVRKIAHRFADEIVQHLFRLREKIFTSKIAFVSNRDGNKEIYLMDYDGENVVRITQNQHLDLFPDLRPRHHQIVFSSFSKNMASLLIFDLLTGDRRTLVSRGGLNTTPEWSPDGQRIVFVSAMDGNAELYTVGADGTGLKRLTFSPAIESSPTWSPTGQQIAFTSDRTGRPQIYVMDSDGSNVRQMTKFGEYNDSAAWSPDGTRIAFVSRHGLQFDIYVLDLTNDSVIRLTENQGSNESPFWAPDGLHLVFSSNRSGRYQLYIMDRWGRNVRQLTFKGQNTNPSWRPFE